jgi:hypothetical protein
MAQALSVQEITNRLGLHDVRNRPWIVQPTCARSGDGLYEGNLIFLTKIYPNLIGLDWLSKAIREKDSK